MSEIQASLKDFAEFFRLALIAEVCDQGKVVRWVDSVIMSEVSLPFVYFDLSTSGSQPMSTVTKLLGEVPGPLTPDRPVHMLLGYCYAPVQSGDLSATELLIRLYKMADSERFPESIYHALLTMEDQLWLARDRVYGAVEEVVEEFTAYLLQYAEYVPTLPA